MAKNIVFLAMLITTISSTSCSSSNENKKAVYQCPMECEGEKTYDKEGQCPVCEMDLEEKKN